MRRLQSSSPDLCAVLRAFRSVPQVQGVALGYRCTDGVRLKDRVAVLAYVDEKQRRSRLSSLQRLPESWTDGEGREWPVDVIEAASPSSTASRTLPGHERYTRRVRPLQAGFSFGLRGRVGTLGLVVQSQEASRPLLLASSHILNRRPDGKQYELYQPAGRDRQAGDRPVAVAARYTQLHPRKPNLTEAAYAIPAEDVEIEPAHPLGPITGICSSVQLGMKLKKTSRTTGETTGEVIAVGWSGRIRFGRRRYPFARQIVIANDAHPISLDGDSGTVWLTESNQAAALGFAGSRRGHAAISTPIATVFKRLNVCLLK